MEAYGTFYGYANVSAQLSGTLRMFNGASLGWQLRVGGTEIETPVDETSFYFDVLQRSTGTYQVVGYIEDDRTWNVQMNFTGQHRCLTDNQYLYTSNYIGYIVSSTGLYKNINSKFGRENIKQNIEANDALPIVELSTSTYDKKVFGVVSLTEDNDGLYKQGSFVSVLERDKGDARIFVNGCGEGSILVSDYNGILENSDYITTSVIAGIGMKQDDDILHAYTVAKITMDCDFEPQLIPVEVIKQEQYSVGSNIFSSNVIDALGNPVYQYKRDQNNDIVYDYEYDMKYITLDGTIVDRDYYCSNLDNTYRMAFVGCVYKCS
jgi:hypothetical protein